MESRESSSPIITRAVAAALQDQYADPYEFPTWQRAALRLLGHLPEPAARWLIPRANSPAALDQEQIRSLSVDDLVANRLADYNTLPGRFPAVIAGVALGGTTAHLSTMLGGPFIPQAFVLTLKGGSYSGDVETYYRLGERPARDLTQRHPDIMTIQHYDPIHDGWLTRRVNHLRIKLLGLPPGYRAFLLDRLEPGGEVIYLDGQASWLRYRTGLRSVFQVGGWGDISAEEFLQASERIQRYCRSAGLTQMDWRLPGFELETGPESEWGSEPGFGEALEEFCQENGFCFTRISLPDPNLFSRLAFFGMQRLLAKESRAPAGVFVEMFSQYDATAVMRCGLLPLWLIFNTLDSMRFLREMVPHFPEGLPVFFSPLATFSVTPDIVPWPEWEQSLAGVRWINVGARPGHYPGDALALVKGSKDLREWCAQQQVDPVRARLSGADLTGLLPQVLTQ